MSDSIIRAGRQSVGTATPEQQMRTQGKQSGSVTSSSPDSSHATRSSGVISGAVSESPQSSAPSVAQNAEYTPPKEVSPEYNAHHTLRTLVSRNSSPVDLLKALSNHSSSPSSSTSRAKHKQNNRMHLHAALDRMSDSQRADVARRLQSPEMQALQQAVREGVGMISVKDRPHTTRVLEGIADNFDFIRAELGIERPLEELNSEQTAAARNTLNGFVAGTEANLVKMNAHLSQESIDKLNQLEPSREAIEPSPVDSRVCRIFGKDVLRSYYVMEGADGSRSWLLSPKEINTVNQPDTKEEILQATTNTAVDRLAKFVTSGRRMEAVTQVLNQSSLAHALLPFLMQTEGKEVFLANGEKLFSILGVDFPMYYCRDNGDYTFTAKASVRCNVASAMVADEAGNTTIQNFNPQTSEYEGVVTFDIGEFGEVKVTDVSYDLRLAPFEGFDPETEGLRRPNKVEPGRVEEMAAIRDDMNIPAHSDLLLMGGDRDLTDSLVKEGLDGFGDRVAELAQSNQLSGSRMSSLETRINFLKDARESLNNIQEEGQGASTSVLVRARDTLSELRQLMQRDQMEDWDLNRPESPDVLRTEISAQAACTRFCEETMRDYEVFLAEADEQNYGLDAGVGADVTAALHSRANHCAMQSRAINKLMHNFYNEVVDIGRQNSEPGLQGEDEVAKLLAESTNRMARIGAALEDYHNGDGPLPEFGRGVSDAEYQSLKKGIIKSLRDGGELPLSHPRLSEAQLMQARIEHFLDQHPGYSEVMRPHMERYTSMLAREIAAGDWSEVRGSFNDVGGDGRRRQLTNILTPGPSMADPAIRSTYDGLGVSHHDHEQTSHAANLAHSQLNNSRGQRLFSGLRHASLASKMSRSDFLGASRERKEIFVRELSDDPRFRALAEQNNCRTMDEMVGLLGSPEHSGEIHSWLREAGTRNAAVDLVSSAVATNPYLRDEALRNGHVVLTLDSVSMLAPSDSEAGRRNGAFQSEQEAALAGLGEGPVRIALTGPDGVRREVDVVIAPRQFNFSVKPRSRLERFLRRVFGGATDWRAMDAKNNVSLSNMLGDLRSDELGGEVDTVLRYLRTGSDVGLSPAQKAFLDDPDSPYHENRADLIEELAGQVKELYNSGSHRNPSSDPHKLVSRIAMLSHMLGHSPAYNCGNGLSRTGGMDVDTKLLAASMAADGRVPSPDTPPDQLRRMHFELNTGQLAMNEKSTGVRRFYERLRSGRMAPGRNDGAARTALRNHFNSPLVRSLYSNVDVG